MLATVLLRLLPMGPAPVRATPPCSSSSSSSCVRLCFFLFFLVSSLPRSHFAHDDFFSFRFTPIFVSCFFLHFFLVSVSFLFVHDDGTGDGPAYTPSSPAHFLTTRNGEENRKETNRQQEPNTATTNKRKPTVLRLTPAPPPTHTHLADISPSPAPSPIHSRTLRLCFFFFCNFYLQLPFIHLIHPCAPLR